MKKILALALALIMLLALCACGGSSNTNTPASKAPVSEAPVSEAPASDDNTDGSEAPSLSTAVSGVLTMATNATFPPYEYVEGGKVVGIDADIAAAIAEKLGLELQIEDMEFDSIIESVKGGKADIGLAGMTVTPEREEEINFTESYATGVQVVIVSEDNDTIAGTNEDLQLIDADGNVLEGTIIGVQRNTTGDLYTTWYMEDEGLATIDRYSKGTDAVQALKTGKVDCVVIDNEPAKSFVAEAEGLKILEAEYVEEMYAGAMSKDNDELFQAVNAALKELIEDGTVQAIIDKYISAD